MTLSKFGKLQRRFDRFINREGNIDPSKLLEDLVGYQKGELTRSFNDGSIQSEQDHNRLTDQLEAMINTLKPKEENMDLSRRRRS